MVAVLIPYQTLYNRGQRSQAQGLGHARSAHAAQGAAFEGGQPWALRPVSGDPRDALREVPDYAQGHTRQASAQSQVINPNEPPAIQRARQRGGVQVAPLGRFASRQDEMSYDGDGQYSPYAYGGEQFRNGIRQAITNTAERMFNRQGQVNA